MLSPKSHHLSMCYCRCTDLRPLTIFSILAAPFFFLSSLRHVFFIGTSLFSDLNFNHQFSGPFCQESNLYKGYLEP